MRKLFTICLASLQIACAAEDFNNKSYEWDIYPVPLMPATVWCGNSIHSRTTLIMLPTKRIKEKSSMPNGPISIIIIGQDLLLQYGRETMFPFPADTLK